MYIYILFACVHSETIHIVLYCAVRHQAWAQYHLHSTACASSCDVFCAVTRKSMRNVALEGMRKNMRADVQHELPQLSAPIKM